MDNDSNLSVREDRLQQRQKTNWWGERLSSTLIETVLNVGSADGYHPRDV